MPDTLGMETLLALIEKLHELSKHPSHMSDILFLRQIKALWQLLLGITESSFDAENFENLKLNIGVEGGNTTKFQCLCYLEKESNTMNEMIMISESIGSPKHSLSVVHAIDESDNGPEDSSVSYKLSILNKVRYILYLHQSILENVFNEDDVVELVFKILSRDLIRYRKENHSYMLPNDTIINYKFYSNNEHLNKIYHKGLLTLLLVLDDDDTDVTISSKTFEVSKKLINTFKSVSRIACFYNLQLLNDFHMKIINIIKFALHKHHSRDDPITEFYLHSPIIPILKPSIRRDSFDEIENDAGVKMASDEPDDAVMSRLTIPILTEILVEITRDQKISGFSEVPISMVWFPQILKNYIEILLENGIENLEDDFYLRLLKKSAISWIEKNINTKEFAKQLCDLSLVPSALPYTYQGVRLPTLEMRTALYRVKEGIRLLDKYFGLWLEKIQADSFLKDERKIWENKVKQKFMSKWKLYLVKCLTSEKKADEKDLEFKVKFSLTTWRQKFNDIADNLLLADKLQLQKWFNSWHRNYYFKVLKLNELETRFSRKNLLRKCYNEWKTCYLANHSQILLTIDKIIIRKYFCKMTSWMARQAQKENLADLKHNRYIKNMYFNKWKENSAMILLKWKTLVKAENTFVIVSKMQLWYKSYQLNLIEDTIKNETSKMLLQWSIKKWTDLAQMQRMCYKFKQDYEKRISYKYFLRWKMYHSLNVKSDKRLSDTCMKQFFMIWRLKLRFAEAKENSNFILAATMIHDWRLQAKLSFIERMKNEAKLQICFNHWIGKSELYKRLEKETKLVNPLLKTTTFFGFWHKELCHVKSLNIKAVKFRDDFILKLSAPTIKKTFQIWLFKYNEIMRQRLALTKLEVNFYSNLRNRIFIKWKNKFESYQSDMLTADNFYRSTLLSATLSFWVLRYDHILEIYDVSASKIDMNGVNLLNRVLSKMTLRMIKLHNDSRNAIAFKERWDKQRIKTFFELWCLKIESRMSPTPSSRVNPLITKTIEKMGLPELDPYIDLGPRSRGSPVFRPRLRNTSIASGSPLIERTKGSPNRLLRTPLVSAGNNSSTMLMSAERMRRLNLEERVLRYRLARSPKKDDLDKVEEITERNVNDQTTESESTPTRRKYGLRRSPLIATNLREI